MKVMQSLCLVVLMLVGFNAMADETDRCPECAAELAPAEQLEKELLEEGFTEESYSSELETQDNLLDFLGMNDNEQYETLGRGHRHVRPRRPRHPRHRPRYPRHPRHPRHRPRHPRRDCHYWGTCYPRRPIYRHVCVAENQWGERFHARGDWPRRVQDRAMNRCYNAFSSNRCYPVGCRLTSGWR